MDKKNKVMLDNSSSCENVIYCPNCGKENNPEVEFCVFCGEEFNTTLTTQNETVAFETIAEEKEVEEKRSSMFEPIVETNISYVEKVSVFAEGLPEWDIVPPQIMVRRR